MVVRPVDPLCVLLWTIVELIVIVRMKLGGCEPSSKFEEQPPQFCLSTLACLLC